MAWELFRWSNRPRLNEMNTGAMYLERSYAPPPTSVFGNGGIPIDRPLGKLAPGVIIPSASVVQVSLGGATNLTYDGTALEALSNAAGSGML